MLKAVRIERPWHSYNSGEVVAFPEEQANELVEQGVATHVEQTRADPTVSNIMPKRRDLSERTVRKG